MSIANVVTFLRYRRHAKKFLFRRAVDERQKVLKLSYFTRNHCFITVIRPTLTQCNPSRVPLLYGALLKGRTKAENRKSNRRERVD